MRKSNASRSATKCGTGSPCKSMGASSEAATAGGATPTGSVTFLFAEDVNADVTRNESKHA